MIKQKKRLEKEKQREHAQRVGRQRRIEADTCAVLMLEAGIAWEDQDMEACHRL
jgi:hypothetical protein